MSIPKIFVGILLLIFPLALLGQNATLNSAASVAADQAKDAPKLEHFDPNLVDKTLNPCDDFYKYACSKWIAANPIPADQVRWFRAFAGYRFGVITCFNVMLHRRGKRHDPEWEKLVLSAPAMFEHGLELLG